MGEHVIIVGGGLAGLASAVGLASAGFDGQITLLESRPRLGGRAGSFRDQTTDEWIDTCQHVAMGCCTNLAQLATLTGLDDLFETQDELLFIGPEGQRCRFRADPLPAPFHLLRAFGSLRYFSLGERWRLCRDVARLANPCWAEDRGDSFAGWLSDHARTADLRDRFWDVILVSALSETADRIAVPYARQVFVEGFLAHRAGWRVQIPRVSLEALYGRRLVDWLTARGVTIRLQSGASRVHEEAGRVTGVALRSGEFLPADEFILAVPWHRAGSLLPESLRGGDWFARVANLESAPIASVHLWFDRRVMDVPHAVLIGRLSQWVFRRLDTTPASSSGEIAGDYLQVVISASRGIAGRSQAEVIGEVFTELASIWPEVAVARLVASRVVTEHRAVFSPQPGVDACRLSPQSPMANLQLAGDWTQTGWPATMEGAVKSGFRAAENVMRRRGASCMLVQPGLQPARLSRWLLGIGRPTR